MDAVRDVRLAGKVQAVSGTDLLLERLHLVADLDLLSGLLETPRLAGAVGRDLELELAAGPLAAFDADAGVGDGLETRGRDLDAAEATGPSLDSVVHVLSLRIAHGYRGPLWLFYGARRGGSGMPRPAPGARSFAFANLVNAREARASWPQRPSVHRNLKIRSHCHGQRPCVGIHDRGCPTPEMPSGGQRQRGPTDVSGGKRGCHGDATRPQEWGP